MNSGPCLAVFNKCTFVFMLCLQFFVVVEVNAQQYYDSKLRRYVFIGEEPVKIKNIRKEMEDDNNSEEQKNVESNVEAYRKFDPNRYHRTEEIDFL